MPTILISNFPRRSLTAGLVLGLICVLSMDLIGQTPIRPGVGPGRAPTGRISKKKQKERKDRKNQQQKQAANLGALGKPGAKPGIKVKRATLRAAKALVRELTRVDKTMREESFRGELTVLKAGGARDLLPLQGHRMRNKDGSTLLLLRHGRKSELPDVALLGSVDAKFLGAAWRYRPEERRTTPLAAQRNIADTILRLDDLMPVSLDHYVAHYHDETVFDGQRAMRLSLRPRGGFGNAVLATVRMDLKVIVKLETFDAAGKALRSISFSGLKTFGVHRRWTKMMVQVHGEAGGTVFVKIKSWKINDGRTGLPTTPEELPKLLE